ncbi:hypothetical protein [Aestuariivivens sediminicola]|uniref:hypothetical protein n=1 Tax=Aestuariivivens sediminicola TaxID=2913560 RepID=UPI001F59AF75|nr:hypothetical protein [Aestuariivivens sediminicola]
MVFNVVLYALIFAVIVAILVVFFRFRKCNKAFRFTHATLHKRYFRELHKSKELKEKIELDQQSARALADSNFQITKALLLLCEGLVEDT